MTKTKKNPKNILTKVLFSAPAVLTAMTSTMTAHAFQQVDLNTQNIANADPAKTMGSAIGIVLTFISWLGIAAIIWGLVDIAMSLGENGQPEKRLKGFAFLGAGVVLVGIRALLAVMGFIA